MDADIAFYQNETIPPFLRELMSGYLTHRQICTTPIWDQEKRADIPFNAAGEAAQKWALSNFPFNYQSIPIVNEVDWKALRNMAL